MIIRISQIISASEILMHLYSIRQDIKIKNTFADIVYSVLVVKEPCKNIEICV